MPSNSRLHTLLQDPSLHAIKYLEPKPRAWEPPSHESTCPAPTAPMDAAPAGTEPPAGPTPAPAVAAILSTATDWASFDVFALHRASDGRPLELVTSHLIKTLGLVERLQLDVARLSSFLAAAEAAYCPQPYHNSVHAADVVQAVGAMACADPWASTLEDWETLALLLAAATHDLGHPGVNNDFHVRTNSDAAQAYAAEGSINERAHAALALELLTAPECDFLATSTLGSDGDAKVRDLVADLILSTDMAHHGGLVAGFTSALASRGPDLGAWPPEERRLALRMLLHCADISNPARPLDRCAEWGRRVQEEMCSQGDRERAMGLDPTPACDRSCVCPNAAQAAFIRHVMRPCIAALEPLAPGFVAAAAPHIDASLAHWAELAGGGGESPTKQEGSGERRGRSADLACTFAP